MISLRNTSLNGNCTYAVEPRRIQISTYRRVRSVYSINEVASYSISLQAQGNNLKDDSKLKDGSLVPIQFFHTAGNSFLEKRIS